MLELREGAQANTLMHRHTNCCLRYSSQLAGAGVNDMIMIAGNLRPEADGGTARARIAVSAFQAFSEGTVRITTRDPDVDPEVDERMLSDDSDLVRMRDGVRRLRLQPGVSRDHFRGLLNWLVVGDDEPGVDRGARPRPALEQAALDQQNIRALAGSGQSTLQNWACRLCSDQSRGRHPDASLERGEIMLHEPKTGRLIVRFTPWERTVHWAAAISFVILAFSGIFMLFGRYVLLPMFGYSIFAAITILGKNLHNFVGPLFVVCTVLLFVIFARDNLPRAYYWVWVRKFGGMLSGEHVPAGRFNAGEKAWFWFGVTLLGPGWQ